MVYFLSLHPSLTIEPAHFLKINGEILPRSRLSDTMRFSTLLDYWWIVADPFSSDIHCMTRFFTYALPPPMPSFFHFTLPIKFPLIVFLGWEQGGQEDPLHVKLFWLSALEGSAWLNNASPHFLKGFFKFVSPQRLLLVLLLLSAFLYSLALFPPPPDYFVSLYWDLMHKLFYNLKFHCSWGCSVCHEQLCTLLATLFWTLHTAVRAC